MTGNIQVLQVFLTQLDIMELVKLRHDAIRLDDKLCKQLVDDEIKRRADK